MSKKTKNQAAVRPKAASRGDKMIEVKVRFWTNNIVEPGLVLPKHAWTSGMVRIERNDSHGIKPGRSRPFQSLLDVGKAIEATLIAHGIELHPSRTMKKYLSDRDAV